MSRTTRRRCPHCQSHSPPSDGKSSCCSACGRRIVSPDDPGDDFQARIGAGSFHHFELIEVVGEGAFGVVWRAIDMTLDRTVALKIGRTNGAANDARQCELIAREARAAAQLGHPGIVSVYEAGVCEGAAYIAAAFVEGQDLKHYLDGHSLPARQAASICLRLAEALAHAHAAGVIHRDLKPGNILLGLDGNPRIADFGLAKREHGDVTVTLRGQALGTPAYMSPEQAMGENRYIDRRTDIYSLGVILYELLTGEPPFRGEAGHLMLQILTQEPRPPRSLCPTLPADLETICLKCLEKDPRRRYQSARELADDLQRFLHGEPIQARPVSGSERAIKWCRRNPGRAAAVATTILMIAGVIVGGALHNQRLSEANRSIAAAVREAEAERGIAQAQSRLAESRRIKAEQTARALADRELATRKLLYVDDIRQAYEFWKVGHLNVMQERLARHVPSDGQADIRGFEWHFLDRLCRRVPFRTLEAHQGPAFDVAFSADGKWMASGGEDHSLRVHDAAGSLAHDLKPLLGTVECLEFSTDGSWLAVGGGAGVVGVYRVSDWSLQIRIEAHADSVTAVVFSPDGRRLFTGSEDRTVALWEFPDGHLIRRSPQSATPVEAVAVSPDGQLLAVSHSDGMLNVSRTENGERVWEFHHDLPVRSVSFGSTGAELATACHDGKVRVFPREAAQPRLILDAFTEPVQSVAFIDEDRFLAAADKHGLLRVWDGDSGVLRDVARCEGGRIFSMAASPTERVLATADRSGCIRLWDLRSLAREKVVESLQQVADLKIADSETALAAAFGPYILCVDLGPANSFRLVPSQEADTWSRVPVRWRLPRQAKAIAISADGCLVACGDGHNRVEVLDAQTGVLQESLEISGSRFTAHSLVFSHDRSRLLVGGSPGDVALCDLRSAAAPRPRIHPETSEVRQAIFTPHESQMLVAGNRVIATYSIADDTLQVIDTPEYLVTCAAFRPDGRIAVTGANGGTLTFWDVSNWQKVRTVKTNADRVLCISFSPDGKTLAVGTDNFGMELWHVETFQEMFTLPFYHATVTSTAFSRSGAFLAVGTGSLSYSDRRAGSIETLTAR